MGLIPAHAGKTSDCSGDRLCVRAHPRSRGENVVRPGATILEPGSSPLTRGKRRRPYRRRQPDRLIPAHAGKTCCSTMWGRNFPAHPRSRGENAVSDPHSRTAYGSSPLTRGKLGAIAHPVGPLRLIPAHAGKTPLYGVATCPSAAHPRSRGENRTRRTGESMGSGSSPLTRGKPPEDGSLARALRLIPAHAGKTLRLRVESNRHAAHPRSRGENDESCAQAERAMGSSPLTRGKRTERENLSVLSGLIPAHAGKTGCRLPRGSGVRAHPRSRGENSTAATGLWRLLGSSPLTRGKPRPSPLGSSSPRLIPAHAGKTDSVRP